MEYRFKNSEELESQFSKTTKDIEDAQKELKTISYNFRFEDTSSHYLLYPYEEESEEEGIEKGFKLALNDGEIHYIKGGKHMPPIDKSIERMVKFIISNERKIKEEKIDKSKDFRDYAEALYDFDEDENCVEYNVESDKYDFNYCGNYTFGFLSVDFEEDEDGDYEITFSSNESRTYESVWVNKDDWTVENIQMALYDLDEKIIEYLLKEGLDDGSMMKRMSDRIKEEYKKEEYFNKDGEYEIVADIDLEDDGRVEEDWEELTEQNIDELEEMTGFHLWTQINCFGHNTLYIENKY